MKHAYVARGKFSLAITGLFCSRECAAQSHACQYFLIEKVRFPSISAGVTGFALSLVVCDYCRCNISEQEAVGA